MFDEMQATLRREVVSALFRAQPVADNQPIETELTKAARQSVDNADKITEAETFEEVNFVPGKIEQQSKKQDADKRKKARKAERQRKTKGKRRK
jgi:hypothetical protein